MTDEPGRTCVAAWLHFLSIGCVEIQRKLIYFEVHPCLCQRREMGPYATIDGVVGILAEHPDPSKLQFVHHGVRIGTFPRYVRSGYVL